MNKIQQKNEQRATRKRRVRARISGTATKPRLTVFKSNKYVYAQLIDDENATTLASATGQKGSKSLSEQAKKVGTDIAKSALEKGIDTVIFDRSGYVYTGRIKILADSAREAGLKF